MNVFIVFRSTSVYNYPFTFQLILPLKSGCNETCSLEFPLYLHGLLSHMYLLVLGWYIKKKKNPTIQNFYVSGLLDFNIWTIMIFIPPCSFNIPSVIVKVWERIYQFSNHLLYFTFKSDKYVLYLSACKTVLESQKHKPNVRCCFSDGHKIMTSLSHCYGVIVSDWKRTLPSILKD